MNDAEKSAIHRAYDAGYEDGFRHGAMAALNKVEPRHAEAVQLGTYPAGSVPAQAAAEAPPAGYRRSGWRLEPAPDGRWQCGFGTIEGGFVKFVDDEAAAIDFADKNPRLIDD